MPARLCPLSIKTHSSKNTHFGDWLLFPSSFTKGGENQLSWILRH